MRMQALIEHIADTGLSIRQVYDDAVNNWTAFSPLTMVNCSVLLYGNHLQYLEERNDESRKGVKKTCHV